MKLNESVVWITGASSGIGEMLSYEINRLGGIVVISARNQDGLEKVKNACLHPDRCMVLPLDLETTEFDKPLKSIIDKYGKLDILINNAGLSQRAKSDETSEAVERKIMEVNYFAPVRLTKQVLPYMKKRGSGQVIVVTSVMGKYGAPLRSSYCAAKHALHGYFDALRLEILNSGIQIKLVVPGAVKTNVSLNAITGDGLAYGKSDLVQEKGISALKAAHEIIRLIQKNTDEIIIGKGMPVHAVRIKRFFPTIFSKIMKKVKVG